jgi:phage shock protein A
LRRSLFSDASPPASPAPTQAPPAADSFVVRILGRSRYRIANSIRPALDGLDSALEFAVEKGDADKFSQLVKQLGLLITSNGQELPEDDLTKADLVVPSDDMTLEEARKLFFEEAPEAEPADADDAASPAPASPESPSGAPSA